MQSIVLPLRVAPAMQETLCDKAAKRPLIWKVPESPLF